MNVALYARVSSDRQAARGTIGSQLDALRARMAADSHHVVAEYVDDGYSGARLDRPGLDALRDAAEAGEFDTVWCLSPDRLARSYAYQVVVLDELARFGVAVRFTDSPPIDDDPQARLLVQMQGVIAEYERAKIAERHRRGKLYRVRAGEAVFWKVPYGYRRVPRTENTPARLEIYEPEAAVVRRIFDDYTTGGRSIREITRRLHEDGIPSPSGKPVWPSSTLGPLLRNSTYAGTARYYRHETTPGAGPTARPQRRERPVEDWVTVPTPAIVSEEIFEAAQAVSRDNSAFSPRRTHPDRYLLRGLVRCGRCGVKAYAQAMSSTSGRHNHYYACANHDPLRAGGADKVCTERRIRADDLDTFVFDQVRAALLNPDLLLAGEAAVLARTPTPDDEILQAQLDKLDRRLDHAQAEQRRLADLYQAGLIDQPELQRRARELTTRHAGIQTQRTELAAQRCQLAADNQLRQRLDSFATRVGDCIDRLDFTERQRLLRLVTEDVRVTGWQVEIRLRIPLDQQPATNPGTRQQPRARARRSPHSSHADPVSSEDRLRSVHADRAGTVPRRDRLRPRT